MNIQSAKQLSWVVAAVLGGGLAWAAWSGNRAITAADASTLKEDQLRKMVEGIKEPPPPRDEIVDYEDIKRTFHQLNWTGKETPKVAVAAADAPVQKPPAKPVAQLLKVLLLKVDKSDPEQSLAFVKFTEPGMTKTVAGKKEQEAALRTGERLPAPHAYVRVERIEDEAIVFAFDEDGRAEEQLGPARMQLGELFTEVGPEGVRMPAVGVAIPTSSRVYRPEETVMVGLNRYQIGTRDAEYVNQNYAQILSQEVRYAQHRDPVTGKYDGIEIKEVKPNSTAAKFGVKSGDIVKSINGHPVSSVNEAISFAKNNNDKYDVWEVVIENMGKTSTVTYTEPPPN